MSEEKRKNDELHLDEIDAAKKAEAEGKELSGKDIRKMNQQALTKYRQQLGSISRRDRNLKITDREWEAIQAGAISENKLKRILANTDPDDLRQRATPRNSRAISSGQVNRIKNLSATGKFTIAEIADQLGLSTSTIKKYLKGVD